MERDNNLYYDSTSTVDEEKRGVPLSQSQVEVGSRVVEHLHNTEGQKIIVAIEGLSGTGKTTLLNAFSDRFKNAGASIMDANAIKYLRRRTDTSAASVVTTLTPFDLQEFNEKVRKNWKGYKIVSEKMKGMTDDETKAYIESLNIVQASLTPEQIKQYSIGIPLLAQQLLLPGLTEDAAVRITARYLKSHWGYIERQEQALQRIVPFLSVPLPDDVLEIIPDLDFSENIYDSLFLSLEERERQKEKGVNEESPLFVAPESEGVYSDMLRKKSEWASIDIYAPTVSSQDLARLQQALGYDQDMGEYNQYKATRAEMFNAFYRKVSFWHRDERGQEFLEENEYPELPEIVKKYNALAKKGELGIQSKEKGVKGSFFIHAHEHDGMTYHPAAIGWMVESLLQQRGIHYFVNNESADLSYSFNPTSGHIETLPERKRVRAGYYIK